jgi:hypothetical protein
MQRKCLGHYCEDCLLVNKEKYKTATVKKWCIYIYGMVIRPSFRILYNGWINRYGLPFPFWQKKPVSHFLGSVEFGDEAQITHKMAHVRGKMMIKHDQLVDLWMTHPMVFSINPGSRIHIGATDMFCFNRDFTGIQTVDLLGYYGDIMGYRITWYLDWYCLEMEQAPEAMQVY